MIKISDAIREIIEANTILRTGMHHDLMNLTRLATFLQPLLEARTKKPVTESAILMALSRIAREKRTEKRFDPEYRLKNITIRSGITSLTYRSHPDIHTPLYEMYGEILSRGGYMTINQGIHETTTLIETSDCDTLTKKISHRPVYRWDGLVALGVQFDEKYVEVPGFLHHLIELLTFQNINIIELSSTYSEIVFYVEAGAVTLAFDTLYAGCM